MTRIPVVIVALMLARSAFSQSEIVFDNIVNASGTVGEVPGALRAPFYGPSLTSPWMRISGNSPGGVPMGSTTYDAPLLSGSWWTVTLWALNSADVTGTADFGGNNLDLIATTTM